MKHILTFIFITGILFAQKPIFHLFKKGDPKSGNTLMVFGGIHGNEPGGYFAPAILSQHYTITQGALWVIPDINQRSITRFRRGINGDMNRKFAHVKKSDPDYETVKAIESLILNKDIDLILNLHDGHGFYRKKYKDGVYNPDAWGQSCVIDQVCMEGINSSFAQLADVANNVSKKLNSGLIKAHHRFNVKNTHTKVKDKAMQLSLTYFAITHNKPAFAIETSKNLHTVYEKTFYQLRAIEAFMNYMGITFKRDFELNQLSIKKMVRAYGKVNINKNIEVNLTGIRPILRYVPLKSAHNIFKFSHPLADIIKRKGYYELYIGHIRVTSLFPQRFEMDNTLKKVHVVIDGKDQNVSLPGQIDVRERFEVLAPEAYRVNVIGYTNQKKKNENKLIISRTEMMPRYAIDRKRRQYRVEIYKKARFCGMIVVNFGS